MQPACSQEQTSQWFFCTPVKRTLDRMDIWEANKLILFLAFVVPGFIALKTYALLEPGKPHDTSQQLIDAIAYSSLNYALWLWPMIEVEGRGTRASSLTAYAAFYAGVVFVSPITLGFAWHLLRRRAVLQRFFPHPTERPWDYVFRQGKPYWMIITLKDGKKVGGRFDACSFASSAPAPEQLYLEQSWVINADEGFERPKVNSAGMLISASEITMLELVTIEDGEEDEHKEAESVE